MTITRSKMTPSPPPPPSSLLLVLATTVLIMMSYNVAVVQGQDIQTNLTAARTTFNDLFSGGAGAADGDIMYGFGYTRKCSQCPLPSMSGPNWVIVEAKDTIRNITDRYFEPLLEDISNEVQTIHGLFDIIQDAIDGNANQIDVTFDTTYGYPSSIYIDYDPMLVDEEYSVEIDAFSPYKMWYDEYMTNLELWDSNLIPFGAGGGSGESTALIPYEYKYQRICFCQEEYLGPFHVKIDEKGIISEVINEFNGVVDTTGNTMWDVPTVDDVFFTISLALMGNTETGKLPAFSVYVEYDEIFGYPTSVGIDYEEFIADEEYGAQLSFLKLNFPETSGNVGTGGTQTTGGDGDGVTEPPAIDTATDGKDGDGTTDATDPTEPPASTDSSSATLYSNTFAVFAMSLMVALFMITGN